MTDAVAHLFPPLSQLLLFVTAGVVLLVIPGPAVLYIVTRSIDQGRRAGLASCLGISTGELVHVLAAAFGLSALLVSSALAYSVVKYAGAAYLIVLGIRKLREGPGAETVGHAEPASLRRIYAQGVVVQVLNPKAALFLFSFLPQFVSPSRGPVMPQILALGLLFLGMGLVSDCLWAVTAGTAAPWLRRHRGVLRNQHYVTGSVFIGLGVATAVSGSKH